MYPNLNVFPFFNYFPLDRCHTTASGYVGPWSPSPTVFNNLYFVLLKGLVWTPNEKTQKLQYKG